MSNQQSVIRLKDFVKELSAASNIDPDLTHCYACARCSSVCKVAIFSPLDNTLTPRSLLYKAIIGKQEDILDSDFIWLCSGCARCEESCPQKVKISEVIRALRRLAIEIGKQNPLSARVNERMCMHCGACVQSCPNDAITLVQGGPRGLVAWVDPAECRGCGSCTSVCSNGAIQQSIFNDVEALEKLKRR